jgi:predicted aminopeptidase
MMKTADDLATIRSLFELADAAHRLAKAQSIEMKKTTKLRNNAIRQLVEKHGVSKTADATGIPLATVSYITREKR